jgi:hypothetical protein
MLEVGDERGYLSGLSFISTEATSYLNDVFHMVPRVEQVLWEVQCQLINERRVPSHHPDF